MRAYRNQARNSCQAYQLVLESCVYYEAPYLDLNRLSSPRTRNECLPTCPTFHPISLQMIGMSDSKVEKSLFSSAADFTFLPYDEMGLISTVPLFTLYRIESIKVGSPIIPLSQSRGYRILWGDPTNPTFPRRIRIPFLTFSTSSVYTSIV